MDQETKNVFIPEPMVTFCFRRKFNNCKIRAKLYPIERIVGSHECKNKRWEVYLNVQETSCFSSSVTNETCKINHQFEWNEKYLVYLLTWKKCLKQYVGQTSDIFRHGWNNYKSKDRNEQLFRNFSSPGQHGPQWCFPKIHRKWNSYEIKNPWKRIIFSASFFN